MSDHDTDQSPAPIKSDGSVFSNPASARPSDVTAEPASSQPMTMNNRWRWAVVALATVLVVGLLGAVFVLARPGGGTPSTVARYAPANSAAYLELREDLPGDQHNLLAQFMSHFPGFADQAAFDTKLNETLDSILGSSPAAMSWTTDVEPWFGGEIAVFSSPNASTLAGPNMNAALSVKDAEALQNVLDARFKDVSSTDRDYQGQTVRTLLTPDASGVSYVVTADALVIASTFPEIQAELDAKADRNLGLADDQFFLQQLGALHADRLGTFYFDGRSLAGSLGNELGGELPVASMTGLFTQAAAARVMGEIRADGDHLSLTMRTEHPADADLPPLPSNHGSTLADLAPKDALVYAEVHDVGQAISWIIQRGVQELPSASGGVPIDLSSMQQLLGSPPQEFFDFIVDAAVSISGTSANPVYGLVASVDDMAIATSRVQKITALLHMLTQFGGGVTFTDETHGAAQVTVVKFAASGSAGSDTTLALSLSNGHLLIGTHAFVINALDRTRDQSLATRPDFQAALSAGGTSNAGVAFVDIAALRTS
ncbi:MAG: DUF3352 domain-containing protein, partial [Chloroflexota bacterium]